MRSARSSRVLGVRRDRHTTVQPWQNVAPSTGSIRAARMELPSGGSGGGHRSMSRTRREPSTKCRCGCRGALRVMVCSSVQFVGPFVLGDIATRHIDVPHVTAARTGVIRACRRSKRGDNPRRPASRAFVDRLRRHARFRSISSAIPTAAFESPQCDSTRRLVWRVSATSPNPSRWGRERYQ
jgi:hypothetical protein